MKPSVCSWVLALLCSVLSMNAFAQYVVDERIKSVRDPLNYFEFYKLKKAFPNLSLVGTEEEWTDRYGAQNFNEIVPNLADSFDMDDRKLKRLMKAADSLQVLIPEEEEEKVGAVWNVMTEAMVRHFLHRQESIEQIEWWSANEDADLMYRNLDDIDAINRCLRLTIKDSARRMVRAYQYLAKQLERMATRYERGAFVAVHAELFAVAIRLDERSAEALKELRKATSTCSTKYLERKQLDQLIRLQHRQALSG